MFKEVCGDPAKRAKLHPAFTHMDPYDGDAYLMSIAAQVRSRDLSQDGLWLHVWRKVWDRLFEIQDGARREAKQSAKASRKDLVKARIQKKLLQRKEALAHQGTDSVYDQQHAERVRLHDERPRSESTGIDCQFTGAHRSEARRQRSDTGVLEHSTVGAEKVACHSVHVRGGPFVQPRGDGLCSFWRSSSPGDVSVRSLHSHLSPEERRRQLGGLEPLEVGCPHLGVLRESCNLIRLDERVPIAAESLALRLDCVASSPKVHVRVGVHVLQHTAQNRLVHLGEKPRPTERAFSARESLSAP